MFPEGEVPDKQQKWKVVRKVPDEDALRSMISPHFQELKAKAIEAVDVIETTSSKVVQC